MTIVSEIIASALRIILCLFFITRERTNIRNLIISVIGAVISCLILNYGSLPFLWLSAFEILVSMFCLKLADNSGKRKELFFCIMYEIGISLWVFIISEALAKLTGIAAFSDRNNIAL